VIGYLEPAAARAAVPPQPPQPTVDVKRADGRTTIGSVQPPAAPVMPPRVMPAAARVLGEAAIAADAVAGTGPGGRVTKSDAVAATAVPAKPPAAAPVVAAPSVAGAARGGREERYQLISPIRQRIAERLVEAQQQAALLTTFNDCDMSAVMALRSKFKDTFQERYGVKLGFMSFFVRAAVEALRAVPQVNAEYREPHIVFRDYYDIGIAVGGGKGLVVPVIRNAELLSFAQVEQTIGDFARRAAENKVKLEELQGGTFTISNGGVYGSMLSTPIINPPQSGILGLHSIQDRPVALNGQVVIRPMMYLALTYDHRLVDGREAVTFLKRIKDTIEDPSRLMLEV
jgi:2-oxoglutarate dehydrogenase E2 component (dihydrolipoamide succinyltransferase)